MIEKTERLSDAEIGERLRLARESAKFTQASAADAIKVARTTIVAIEQGQRRVRMDELQKLATIYGTSANAILRREAVHLDMIPHFRKLPQSENGAIESAARLLNDLVRAEVELENALGVNRTRNYPPSGPSCQVMSGRRRSKTCKSCATGSALVPARSSISYQSSICSWGSGCMSGGWMGKLPDYSPMTTLSAPAYCSTLAIRQSASGRRVFTSWRISFRRGASRKP